MNGDGHHSDQMPIPSGPRISPEQLGEIVGLLRAVLREEVERAVTRAIAEAPHPPLADLNYLVWYSQTSEATVRRRLKKYDIPKRNIHGQPWSEGDGPVRYAFAEWATAQRLGTRTITNYIRRIS